MALNPVDSTPVERSAARIAPVVRSDSFSDQTDLSLRSNSDTLRLASADRPTSVRGFNPGEAPTVTDLSIVNGDSVIAASEKKPLADNVLNAAKVKKGEGYFQSAERLLGGEFTHREKKQFTDALRKNWATDHSDANTLRRGDELLTEKNRNAVLSNIADPALRARIADRLNKGLPEAKTNISRPERRPDRRPVPGEEPVKKEKPVTPENRVRRPDVTVPPGDLSNVPDGPIKNPLDARFDVGDRFTGLTSTYGSAFNGRKTASGIPYNNEHMTAASRELPFGTILSVYNPATKKEVQVVITDKGPFAGKKEKQPDGRTTYERVVDLSTRADRELGRPGLAPLQYKILHIPENSEWGMKRPNLSTAGQRQLEETVRRYSRR
jgi:rare lipoprotein A